MAARPLRTVMEPDLTEFEGVVTGVDLSWLRELAGERRRSVVRRSVVRYFQNAKLQSSYRHKLLVRRNEQSALSDQADREAIVARERRRFMFHICSIAECAIRTAEKVLTDPRGAGALQSFELRNIVHPLVTQWRHLEAEILRGERTRIFPESRSYPESRS